MSGLMMGLSRERDQVLMPEIEAFADISDYIEEPVRVYSSRIADATGVCRILASRPDILIVDEALSVGDSVFRQNCYAELRILKSEGHHAAAGLIAPVIWSNTATAPFSSKW